MDLTVELEQFVGLISFLIKFGCYYIPTIIGAIVSFCTKTSKVKRKKKGGFRSFLIQVFAFSITPAFLILVIAPAGGAAGAPRRNIGASDPHGFYAPDKNPFPSLPAFSL